MKEIELLTREGEKVTKAYVPLLRALPELIMWGNRYFLLRPLLDDPIRSMDIVINNRYFEVSCVVSRDTNVDWPDDY